MSNSKMTKRALLTSVMALVLCFAMLTGTTFAWFTDTETSSNNRIIAGNLDVDLLMYNGEKYVSIANTEVENILKIFSEGDTANATNATLWEPGATHVAYLAIQNKGNLDLKYTVSLDVKETDGKNLYEVMEYAITRDAKDGTGVTEWSDGTDVILGVQPVSGNVELKAGVTHYFALSVHMKEEADNKYMEGEINFDLQVLATQLNSENDTFGPNYDALSEYPNGSLMIEVNESVDANDDGTFTIADDNGAYEISGNSADTDSKTTAKITPASASDNVTTIAANNGQKVVAYDIEVENFEGDVTIKLYVGKGLANVVVYHNGEEMGKGTYTYDSATGYVTITTDSFSVYDIAYVAPEGVTSADEIATLLKAAKAGSTVNVSLANDISVNSMLQVPNAVTFVLNGKGHKMIANLNTAVINATNSNIEIKDLTITGDAKFAIYTKGAGWEYDGVNAEVSATLTNVTVDLDNSGDFPVAFNGIGNITMKDCVVTGAGFVSNDHANGLHVFAGAEINLTVDGGNIGGIMLNSNYAGRAEMTAQNGAVIDKVDIECSTATDGSLVIAPITNNGATINETVYAVYNTAQLDAVLKAGKDVVLAKDIAMEAHIDSVDVGNINIDGNGHTLTLRGIHGKNGANVTLKNMTLVDNNPDDYTIYNQGGKVELTNVTYSGNINKAIWLAGGGEVVLTDCNISGEVTGTYSASNIWCGDGRTVTVNGGNYGSIFMNAQYHSEWPANVACAASKITLNNGTINKLILETETNSDNTGYVSATLTQNGGTITELVENPQNLDLTGLTKLN